MFGVASLFVMHVHPAFAQSDDQAPPPQWHYSYEMFQMLLEQRGLAVTRSLELSLSTPSASVVVLFGDQSRISRDQWLQLRRFVGQGGSLLVASERSIFLPGICSFVAGPAMSENETEQYQSFADCLQLDAVNKSHPLTQGVGSIVVNRAGWLTPPVDESLSWEVIVSLPDDCSPKSARGQAVILAGLDPEPDRGVMILAADQSLFSNGMLWHGDNAILAIRVSELLCRGQRTQLTVIADERPLPGYRQSTAMLPPQIPPQIPPDIELPDIELPEPELATLLRAANAVVDKVQESNILNEALRDRPRNMRPVAWLRTVLLILLLLTMLIVLWKLMQMRSVHTPARLQRFMQSMYGVLSAKQIAASEFGAAVEILARDVCAEITGSKINTDWVTLLSDKSQLIAAVPPPFRKGLKEIAGIAVNGCRVHISRRKFQSLGRIVQELRKHTVRNS